VGSALHGGTIAWRLDEAARDVGLLYEAGNAAAGPSTALRVSLQNDEVVVIERWSGKRAQPRPGWVALLTPGTR
jgi:hypothetical protein